MAITPLDLQTMFVRLNEVGKEQNHLKEAVASQQAAGAKELKEQELQQDKSVNKTEEDKEAQKLKDEGGGANAGSGSQENEKKDSEAERPPKKVFSDPDMGSHIDISG
ncbi:hypothetical protein [Spirochaeta isovalerica]|uniref:Uncharacterized protein n=1 Tax=Spirochaeta isovalerica TaxID=150 RepID=A0A841RD40_9SPIO|nr:hypothetical protein [Spirochaeta isovalerica]MBB6481935.1 hypothetical protein [Spirochaeta isovalerica]